jgi:hypothetical protein
VVLKPKELEIRKIVKTVKEPKNQILCHVSKFGVNDIQQGRVIRGIFTYGPM